MATYNLFDGGDVFGSNCVNCGDKVKVDAQDLPFVVQPDLRADGGYGFRHKTNWSDLMLKLRQRYDKGEGDLKVGDRLRIFVQPNHAQLESVFIDFKHAVNGFNFSLSTTRGTTISTGAISQRCTYDPTTGEILGATRNGVNFANDQNNGTRKDNMQYLFKLSSATNAPRAQVDAVELVITALPANGLEGQDFDAWFTRRFTQEGMMI